MIHFEHIPDDILLYIEKLQQALQEDDNVVFAYLFGGLAKGTGNHIISDKEFRTPVTYADAFKVLCENGIITNDMLFVMEKMAKFRNIVVHQYENIDAAIIITILKKHLDNFMQYKDAIIRYLQNSV